MLGEQHKKSYPINLEKVRSIVHKEYMHADVVGPMKKQSIGGARYFLPFKDECTRYRYIFFLKQKSKVFKSFQHQIMITEHDIGTKLNNF